jgi:uncharacterized SAM-binding protein YcdF (DUF218 family)
MRRTFAGFPGHGACTGAGMRRGLLFLLLLWSFAALALDTWGRTRVPSGGYDAIIVAGCRVTADGTPSPALAWRVRTAVALWRDGRAPLVVFTGGVGDFPPSEAEAAAALAMRLGLPERAVRVEDASTSTEENARNAALRVPARHVLVVTDAYHVFRARRVFAEWFPHVDAVASPYVAWTRVRGAYREVVAVGAYAVTGRL